MELKYEQRKNILSEGIPIFNYIAPGKRDADHILPYERHVLPH